jgi:hypothetical protein
MSDVAVSLFFGGKPMLEITSTTDEKVLITVSPKTQSGKDAKLDGPIEVVVQSGSGTFAPGPDPNSQFYAVSEDGAGETTYQVNGDADLGAGVETISDGVHYVYSSPKAVNLGVSAGAPEPK